MSQNESSRKFLWVYIDLSTSTLLAYENESHFARVSYSPLVKSVQREQLPGTRKALEIRSQDRETRFIMGSAIQGAPGRKRKAGD